MTPMPPPADRSLVITRTLNAPRHLVWRVLTDPRHIPFFWGPDGFSTTVHEMDVRVGGLWRYTMLRQGQDFENWIRYRTVQAPALLEYDHGGDDPDHALFEASIRLEEVDGDKTHVTLTMVAEDPQIMAEARKCGAQEGGAQTLARLEQQVLVSDRDLGLTRIIDVPRALAWKAWTLPEHLVHWWCPVPWKTTICRIDLRPGGEFYTHMEGPDGGVSDNPGCYLLVEPEQRLVFTNMLRAGFRPAEPGFLPFTAEITFEDHGPGTRYTARAMHLDRAGRDSHADMGFFDGWSTAIDQLVAYVKAGKI
jgi:uncharacterized protein YndB with AHSA1/START domain